MTRPRALTFAARVYLIRELNPDASQAAGGHLIFGTWLLVSSFDVNEEELDS